MAAHPGAKLSMKLNATSSIATHSTCMPNTSEEASIQFDNSVEGNRQAPKMVNDC